MQSALKKPLLSTYSGPAATQSSIPITISLKTPSLCNQTVMMLREIMVTQCADRMMHAVVACGTSSSVGESDTVVSLSSAVVTFMKVFIRKSFLKALTTAENRETIVADIYIHLYMS
jgi:hypothetical protein